MSAVSHLRDVRGHARRRPCACLLPLLWASPEVRKNGNAAWHPATTEVARGAASPAGANGRGRGATRSEPRLQAPQRRRRVAR